MTAIEQQQLEALEHSINEHWIPMRDDPNCDHEPAPRQCKCCQLWYWEQVFLCEGCPIKEYTGRICCRDTPYPTAFKAWARPNRDEAVWIEAATNEIDFLREVAAWIKAGKPARAR